MKLILPNTFVFNYLIPHPVFFLIGPDFDSGNWTEKCLAEISKSLPEFCAIIPCSWTADHKLFKHRLEEVESLKFFSQFDWESHYITLIRRLNSWHQGCSISWIPGENLEKAVARAIRWVST